MREVFADFMLLQDLPDGTRRIRINARRIAEGHLHDGDLVRVVEDGQLQAPAVIRCVAENGTEHWYAVITGPIEDLIEVG
jgi:hypothetical protein